MTMKELFDFVVDLTINESNIEVFQNEDTFRLCYGSYTGNIIIF